MVYYECFRCGYNTKFKSSLINHLNRKNICDAIEEDISIEIIKKHYNLENITKIPQNTTILPQNNTKTNFENTTKYHQNPPKMAKNTTKIPQNTTIFLENIIKKNECKYCNKIFSRYDSLNRHIKICKKKKNIEEIEINQNEKIIKMEKEIEKLKKNKTNIQNNTNITTNNNHINNNIIINNYGNENLNHLRTRDFLKLFDGIFGAVPKLIEKIPFDRKHPENKNIKYTNKKLPFIKVVKDNKWQLVNKKPELLDLIDSKYYMLKEKYYEIINKGKNNISDVQRSRIDSYFKKYQEEDKKIMLDLINRTELVLLNNS